jgi:hypothetical protein
MRRSITLRVLTFLALCRAVGTTPAFSQDITCTPTTLLAKQHRTNMKHRDPSHGTPQVRTVVQVLNWAVPAGIQDKTVRRQDSPFAGREQDAQVYEITGDLWRVRVEANDCDFHLEISAPGQPETANRIIVEIAQGPQFLAARQKVIDELIANGFDAAVDKPIDLDEPLRIKVVGLAFYDSAHFSKKNPKRGHGHGTKKVGTLWELHPSWDIQFPD